MCRRTASREMSLENGFFIQIRVGFDYRYLS